MNRVDRKPCMIYPEDTWKESWDLIVSAVLIFTCCSTPFRLAFVENETTDWKIANYAVDFIFFIDMILIFNQAYYDEDFKMIQHRGIIAITYIKGWFFIDLMAILPISVIQELTAPAPDPNVAAADSDGSGG